MTFDDTLTVEVTREIVDKAVKEHAKGEIDHCPIQIALEEKYEAPNGVGKTTAVFYDAYHEHCSSRKEIARYKLDDLGRCIVASFDATYTDGAHACPLGTVTLTKM